MNQYKIYIIHFFSALHIFLYFQIFLNCSSLPLSMLISFYRYEHWTPILEHTWQFCLRVYIKITLFAEPSSYNKCWGAHGTLCQVWNTSVVWCRQADSYSTVWLSDMSDTTQTLHRQQSLPRLQVYRITISYCNE